METKVNEATNDKRIRSSTDRGSNRRQPAHRLPGVSGCRERLLTPTSGGSSESARLTHATGAFVSELAGAVADIVESRLGEQIAAALEANRTPRVLDRRGLAESLGCGVDTVDKLRAEGLPQLLVGDAPRFEFDRVLIWLRERGAK